jgi:hypothetical protein
MSIVICSRPRRLHMQGGQRHLSIVLATALLLSAHAVRRRRHRPRGAAPACTRKKRSGPYSFLRESVTHVASHARRKSMGRRRKDQEPLPPGGDRRR